MYGGDSNLECFPTGRIDGVAVCDDLLRVFNPL
jgi:hypothetical protein